MHLRFSHRTTVVPAFLVGAAFLVAFAGLSYAQPAGPIIESSLGGSPFTGWDEATERIYQQENGHAEYSAEIHYDLGLYFYELGEYDLSLKHYRRAVEIDPDFGEAFFGIGLLFYSLGDDQNAVSYYQQSLDRNPADADTRNNIGLIYYRQGKLDEARFQIEEAVRLQPEFADAFYNLGLVYYQEEELQSAVTNFLTALRMDPEYLRARFNLGVVYFELGMLELAEEQWALIQESAPGTDLAEQALQNLSVLQASLDE